MYVQFVIMNNNDDDMKSSVFINPIYFAYKCTEKATKTFVTTTALLTMSLRTDTP